MLRPLALPACLGAAALAAVVPALTGGSLHDQANGGGVGSRAQIRAVGSSTVYPFTTIVAEQWLETSPYARAPVIESTGTGAGMRLFCAGIGAAHPDIEDASRRMKRGEYAACAANGVDLREPLKPTVPADAQLITAPLASVIVRMSPLTW